MIEEKYGIIYIIKNKVNNKLYIGQTIEKRGFKGRYKFKGEGIERVYNEYQYCKLHDKNYNEHLLKSINKYGFEAFEIIEEFDVAYSKEELDKLEDMYIKIYETINSDYGYNNKYGGSFGKHTNKTKQKISEATKGENNPMYGREGKLNPFFGRKHSEETIENIRNKKLGGNNPTAKAVYCIELNDIRLSMKEWADELNLIVSHISRVCRGIRKTTGGYHFRYATEEEIKEYKIKHGIY